MLDVPYLMLNSNQHQNEDELMEMMGRPYNECIKLCHTIEQRINELRDFIKEISEKENSLGPEDGLNYRKKQRPKLKEQISILLVDIRLLDKWNFDCTKNIEEAYGSGRIFNRVMDELDREHALFSDNQIYFDKIVSDAKRGKSPPLSEVEERLRNISSDIHINLSNINCQ